MKTIRLDRHIKAQAAQSYPELERRDARRERYLQKQSLFMALYSNGTQDALALADMARGFEEVVRFFPEVRREIVDSDAAEAAAERLRTILE